MPKPEPHEPHVDPHLPEHDPLHEVPEDWTHNEWTTSPDPFEPLTADTAPIVDVSPGDGEPSPARDPIADVHFVVGAAEPDPIRVGETPVALRERLDRPIPAPDVSHLSPDRARAESERHGAMELMRKAGLAARGFEPPARPPEAVTKKRRHVSEKLAAAVEAYRGTLAQMWSQRRESAALVLEVKAVVGADADTRHAAEALREAAPFRALGETLERWSTTRRTPFKAVELASIAEEVASSLRVVHDMSLTRYTEILGGDPEHPEHWQDEKDLLSLAAALIAQEFARQVGEHLTGAQYDVPPLSQGPVFSLRSGTSLYAGEQTALRDLGKAVAELTANSTSTGRWQQAVTSAEPTFSKSFEDVETQLKEARRLNTRLLADLSGSADTMLTALRQARDALAASGAPGVGAAPAPDPSLTRLSAIALSVAEKLTHVIAAAGVEARQKLEATRNVLQRQVARESPLDLDSLAAHWETALRDSYTRLPASWDSEKTRAFKEWLEGAGVPQSLETWLQSCRDVQKRPAEYLASTEELAARIARCRAAVRGFFGRGAAAQDRLFASLDDIALKVATTTVQYHALFPRLL